MALKSIGGPVQGDFGYIRPTLTKDISALRRSLNKVSSGNERSRAVDYPRVFDFDPIPNILRDRVH